MKRYTTKTFKALALCLMAFPFTYLLATALLFDIPGGQCVRILLSPSFYVLSGFAIFSGYSLWEVRPWAWHVFLFSCFLISYNNALLAAQYSESNHKLLAFLISLAAIVGLIYRIGREMRVPYFLPNIRWWESNPRYRLSAPIQIQPNNGTPTQGEILDLSMSGCFVKLRTEIPQHSPISLHFSVFGVSIHCSGIVVWCTPGTVTHPKGIGIKFNPIPRPTRRALRTITQRLKKIAVLYRTSRYLMTQEEFAKRLDEIQGEKISETTKDHPKT